ncbi:MAG: site-specific integrase, partial [Oscillospiraceae bacterium]|nr:site-specific integrase [Oscillospiraceae bacterium]
MPIYKTSGKKNGLQRYNVRINYVADNGQPTQLTRVAYGMNSAKILEMKMLEQIKIKEEHPVKKMTVQQLFDEYIVIKKYEIKETSLLKIEQLFKYYILPTFKHCRIDKITPHALQEWKILLEKNNLSLHTKKSAYGYFRAFINYAIKMDYIHKNPLTKIGNFKQAYYIKSEMNFYTPDEFKAFISKAKEIANEKEKKKKDLSEWNYYVFFNIAFYTGLRKGEIHALKWTDI